MFRLRHILFCLLFAFSLGARAAGTNLLVWNTATDRVTADVRSERLWPLLEDIAHQTGWHIFVEPGSAANVSAKFKALSSGDALHMLFGDLNFALVPQTNAPSVLYIFRTTMQSATQPVRIKKPVKRVANELLIRVKPGADVEALAKSIGAKITGRLDKLGLYRLQFADATATDAALAQLQTNTDVSAVDYNYIYDAPPSVQPISSANLPAGAAAPLSLQLNPPGASGKVIIGLLDMNVQSLGPQIDKFVLPQISVAGDAPNNADITHATAMLYNFYTAISTVSPSGTSVQVLPVDIYGGSETTTSWSAALGIQAAVNNGATILNMSFGSASESSVLNSVIAEAQAHNIVMFGAAGNTSVNTPTWPGATSGVYDITALGQTGQLASYANYWSGVSMALPGSGFVNYGGQTYMVQGTSTATAYASGMYAGMLASTSMNQAQIIPLMQTKFPVPKK